MLPLPGDVENLGLSIVRKVPGNMTFLADPGGRPVLELYSNPSAGVMDFSGTHFLSMHLAFLVADPQAIADKLCAAGAKVVEPFKVTDAGDRMVMLKDPFGISIQFIRRARPMFQRWKLDHETAIADDGSSPHVSG